MCHDKFDLFIKNEFSDLNSIQISHIFVALESLDSYCDGANDGNHHLELENWLRLFADLEKVEIFIYHTFTFDGHSKYLTKHDMTLS